MPATLPARFADQLKRAPERCALAFYSSEGQFTWRTTAEVYARGAAVARRLSAEGLGAGDACVLAQSSDERCATSLLATLMLGALPLLVAPPSLQGERSHLGQVLRHVVRKSRARLVVADESILSDPAAVAALPRGARVLAAGEATADAAAGAPTVFADPGERDVVALQLTSGTTGFPRICVWRQRNVVAALDGMTAAMGLTPREVCLNWTPLYHDMGLVNNFLLCLATGVPLVMLNPVDFVKKPALWLRALHDTGATLTWSPNFGFALAAQRIRDDELGGVRLDRVRAFWNAAERIHLSTFEAFRDRFARFGLQPHALKTNFGCAENVGGATFSALDAPFPVERLDADALQAGQEAIPVDGARDGARVATVVGVGRPCPGIKVAILSTTGRRLPEGHVGELALDTPSRMVGYLGDVRATRRAIRGRLLRTGDLGYVRNGEVFWVGRVKERLTVRGRKLDPSDFEPILLDVAGLRHGCFVCFGVDDPRLGTQRVVVAAEVRDPATAPSAPIQREIRDRALRQLGIAVDEVILLRPGALPKTSSGKRRHRAFRQLYLEGNLRSLAIGGGS